MGDGHARRRNLTGNRNVAWQRFESLKFYLTSGNGREGYDRVLVYLATVVVSCIVELTGNHITVLHYVVSLLVEPFRGVEVNLHVDEIIILMKLCDEYA